jgi:hypothetical protein
MADDYLTPEERVAARKKVLSDYIDVAQPAQAQQDKAERDSLKKGVMAQTSALGAASPQLQGLGSLGILTNAANTGAELIPQQNARQDKLNLAGAQQQQGIADAKSTQAVGNVARGLENDTQRMARLVADKAFSEGMEAKKLLFHENAALADYSLEVLAKDFEAGRVSQRELIDLKNQLTQRATQKKYDADAALQTAMEEFKTDLAAGNAERAKTRLLDALKAQEAALKDSIRASSISSILSGGFGILGTVAISTFKPGAN